MSNEPRTCAICDSPFTESNEAVECYGCQSIVHDDCASTVTVEPQTWENPAVLEWCCDECAADDRAAQEEAELRDAENRAYARAMDRAHYDDMRY